MSENVVPAQTQIELVRGDMPEWTDQRDAAPAPSGVVLTHLVDTAVAALSAVGNPVRALVAGPHAPGLVDTVVDAAESTVLLVRGHSDAVAAEERYQGRPVRVVCGDLADLDGVEATFVLALDGLERLTSLNVDGRSWGAAYDLLRVQAAPDAAFLLGVDNPVALQVLADPRDLRRDTNADWRPATTPDPTVPASPEALEDLTGATAVWAARADLRHPSLLARAGVRLDEALEVHATPRLGPPLAARHSVSLLATHGGLDALVAGWVAVRLPGGHLDGVAAIGAFGGGQIGCELSLEGGVLRRRPVVEDATAGPTAGWHLEFTSAEGAVPQGRLLESVLLEAIARRDQVATTAWVRAWADRVRGAGDQLATWSGAGADNVVVGADGELSVLDPSRVETSPRPAEALVARHLADLALRLSDLGWRHPWPVASGPVEVTEFLLAMAGLAPDAAEDAVDEIRLARRRARVAQPEPAPEVIRLAAENQALRSKVRWFENALRERERVQRRVREMEQELEDLRGSLSFRAGRALTLPARRAIALRRR